MPETRHSGPLPVTGAGAAVASERLVAERLAEIVRSQIAVRHRQCQRYLFTEVVFARWAAIPIELRNRVWESTFWDKRR